MFGDIGPTGKLLKPLGPLVPADAVDAFAEQAAALAEGDVDAILIETMSDLTEAKLAIEGVRKTVGLPILVTFSFDTRGHTMMGVKPALAAREIWAMGSICSGSQLRPDPQRDINCHPGHAPGCARSSFDGQTQCRAAPRRWRQTWYTMLLRKSWRNMP